MVPKYNVAVIGVGNIGKHHARVYSEIKGLNLAAVADTNPKIGRQVAKKYGCRCYDDYIELLNTEKIDAVSIAVPTSLHRNVAIACLERSIPVIIEKPIADTVRSAEEIINLSRKKGVRACVGHIERFNPVVQKLSKLIKQDRFGKIIAINSRRVGLFPSQIKDTDVIMDLAVHDIDVCNFLLEAQPVEIQARAGKALNSRRFDYASIYLRYDSTDVILQVNWITPVKVRELILTGKKGYAELNYLTQTIKLYKTNYTKGFDSYGDYVTKFGIPSTQEIRLSAQEPLKIELMNFIKHLKDGDGNKVVSLEEGLANLNVVLEAIRSAEKSS